MKLVLFAAALALSASPAVADWKDKAVELARAEPKVVDAMFADTVSFWASVRDDGSSRDGYARYLCMTLFDAGMPSGGFVVVKVWDAAEMARSELVQLGRHDCKNNN